MLGFSNSSVTCARPQLGSPGEVVELMATQEVGAARVWGACGVSPEAAGRWDRELWGRPALNVGGTVQWAGQEGTGVEGGGSRQPTQCSRWAPAPAALSPGPAPSALPWLWPAALQGAQPFSQGWAASLGLWFGPRVLGLSSCWFLGSWPADGHGATLQPLAPF